MPRTARQHSETGIYHIIVRGINRQTIFYDDEDYQRYLNTLGRIMENSGVYTLGYCLMNNHAHLLIQDIDAAISTIMKRIGASYAYWYNRKYERSGHVFQDRFKSENVEDDIYLKTVIRYIHQNPIKAGITSKAESYPWSSCRVYYGAPEHPPALTKKSLILGIFAEDEKKAIEVFRNYMNEANNDLCMDDSAIKRISDADAKKLMANIMKGRDFTVLTTLSKTERDIILHEFKEIEGISLRQIARICGLGYQIVNRA